MAEKLLLSISPWYFFPHCRDFQIHLSAMRRHKRPPWRRSRGTTEPTLKLLNSETPDEDILSNEKKLSKANHEIRATLIIKTEETERAISLLYEGTHFQNCSPHLPEEVVPLCQRLNNGRLLVPSDGLIM
jgi:hypothetical protein